MKNPSIVNLNAGFKGCALGPVLLIVWLAGGLPAWGEETVSSNSPVVSSDSNLTQATAPAPGLPFTSDVLTGSTLPQEKTNSREKDYASPLSEPGHEPSPAAIPIELSDTNSSNTAPEPGSLPTPGVVDAKPATNQADQLREYQVQLELARKQRHDKSTSSASRTLVALLQTNAPPELKRQVLFELALVAQDDNQSLK